MLTQPDIEQHARDITAFLTHSFPSISVEHVTPDTVHRPDAEQLCDTYQEYFRHSIPPETKQEILDTREDIRIVLQDQLLNMEKNSPAPDTRIVATHHPPQHIKKNLVFYVLATL